MNTSHPTTPVRRRSLRPFHTPVRGSVFASRPVRDARLRRATLTLRREPDNPADRWAVAVWADDGGTPWRVGYLDRGVAVRLAAHDDDAVRGLGVAFAGWWEEPGGRWRRPVVRIGDTHGMDTPSDRGLRALPPFSHRRHRSAA